MKKRLMQISLIACCAALPLAAVAGVTGTHGPDRGSGVVVAKPKAETATEDKAGAQDAKPQDNKQTGSGKEAK
jgi:hypothetical protein